MSVAGFDIGNCTSCVALARKRGIDVIMNSESKRETPAMVSFGDKMRFVGVDGAARLMMNVKNTVVEVKRLIGRKFKDPAVQEDIKNFMYKVTEAPDGGCLISVMFQNEQRQFTPEQVMTSLLKDSKLIAERDQGSSVTDCVISVPVFYTEAERQAMLNSASLAGLKCLRLMNEPTATALNWGIFKPDLPEDKPLNMVFVDVGHAAFQVSVVAFKKGQMEVKAHAWDRSLGGRDLDQVLINHFAAEFRAKTGLDILSNGKARFRMATQVEKTRQVLTVNPEAPIAVECLMEEQDFKSHITRDKFEELAAPVLERVMQPCKRVLELAQLSASDIHGVELVGAASRTPSIVTTISAVFQQEPKRTMNIKECVARGCSLQCAMLSPIFQVRNFDVKDLYPFRVNISWEKEDGPATNQLFGPINRDGVLQPQHLPCVKAVKFLKTEPFTVRAAFGDGEDIGGADRHIADFHVTAPHKAPPGATNLSTTITFELDLHGLVRCTSVVQNHKVEVEESVIAPKAAAGAADASPMETDVAAPSGTGEDGDAAPMDTDAAAADKVAEQTAEEARVETVKKTKKVTKEAKYEQKSAAGMSVEQYQKLLEEEGQMAADDALQTATNEAKNTFEEYVYALRAKLQGECAAYAKDADREALIAELNKLEDWLYEDGEDESKSVYDAKYKELRAKGDPIVQRYAEAETRDAAVQALSNVCQHNLEWCNTTDAKYAHIEAAHRDKVRAECASALTWLEEKNKQQAALSKTDPPAVLTADLNVKRMAVENMCNPIINTPVPPPLKEEPKPTAAKADEADAAAPMDEDKPAGDSDKPEGDKPAEAAAMDEST